MYKLSKAKQWLRSWLLNNHQMRDWSLKLSIPLGPQLLPILLLSAGRSSCMKWTWVLFLRVITTDFSSGFKGERGQNGQSVGPSWTRWNHIDRCWDGRGVSSKQCLINFSCNDFDAFSAEFWWSLAGIVTAGLRWVGVTNVEMLWRFYPCGWRCDRE